MIPIPENNGRKKNVVAVSIPIKDIETIENLKSLYSSKGDKKGLLLFTLAINTGVRLKDLLELNVGDVKGKQYLVIDGKKSIPLSDDIKTLIKNVCGKRGYSEPLFTRYKSNARLDRATVFFKFREFCRELALDERISVASWRKTFGYFYYEKYKDLSFLQWYFSQNGVEETMQFIGVEENMNLRLKEGVCL